MSETATPPPPARDAPQLEISRGLVSWLLEQRVGLAFTSYQTGRLLMVGAPRREFGIQDQAFTRALGLALAPDGQDLWLASQAIVWRLHNVARDVAPGDAIDRVYQAKTAHITGDLDIHELGVGAGGEIVFVNTRYSCLATLSPTESFRVIWKPSFISRLAAEDRCHLNGLAMSEGRPAYVTACSRSDVVEGWRNRRGEGGVIIDVRTDQVVAEGLSMPHSPRIGPDGRLWVLESGRGQVVALDPGTGRREDVVFCPGFLRGLAFHGHFAVATLSKPRGVRFEGLELDGALKARDGDPACGVLIIDLRSGDIVETLKFNTGVEELFDVIVLPGVRCPMALGPTSPHLGAQITIEEN